MRDGRIVADGPKRDTLTAPALRQLFGVEVELADARATTTCGNEFRSSRSATICVPRSIT